MSEPEEPERPEPTKPAAPDPAIRWVAIGSLAAVVAALIALLSYVTPRATATQPTTTASASAVASIQAGPPARCDDARAAITTYDNTAGSTTDSQASAALQAYDTLLPESTEAGDEDISSDITVVAEDFYLMNQIQTGALQQSYSAAVQKVNSDIQTLSTACGFG